MRGRGWKAAWEMNDRPIFPDIPFLLSKYGNQLKEKWESIDEGGIYHNHEGFSILLITEPFSNRGVFI